MNQSDEEEDFHSADEDGWEEEERQAASSTNKAHESKQAKKVDTDKKDRQCNDEVINKEAVSPSTEQKVSTGKSTQDSARGSDEDLVQATLNNSQNNEPSIELKGSDQKQDEYEEEDEGALAERIRERNLKIARKFSAEIARNLRASAPIPVKTPNPTSNRERFRENSDLLDCKSSVQPPAPPSTPALSSSFNNLSDPTAQTAGTSPSLNTQYSWRVPPKIASQQSNSGTSTPSENIKAEEQARHILDGLSERLSQTDKNLFERVAADIKKVSLGNEEVQTATADLPSALTSITDLGSTLGGWGWSGATKILSSASQVTSQVGSVLDSVVGVSATNAQATENVDGATRIDGSTVPGDPGDSLVDLTLNAMESLGKKAFDVMTTRDEIGSLQIKGLGRPWEHFVGAKVDDSQAAGCQEPSRQRSPSPPDYDATDRRTTEQSLRTRSESPPPPSMPS